MNMTMRRPRTLAWLPILSTFIVGCASGGDPGGGSWRVDTAFEAPHKLGGCALGDVDPDSEGLEVVAAGVTGQVYVIRHDPETASWTHEQVAHLGGEMIVCACGDIDGLPGDELITAGMLEGPEEGGGPGAAYWVKREDDGWGAMPILEDTALIHGACVADLLPDRGTMEVALVGFSLELKILAWDGQGLEVVATAALPGAGKNVVPYLDGVAVACESGHLVHVHPVDGVWTPEVMHRASAGYARLASQGELLLAARDDGQLWLFGDGDPHAIHREGEKLRGAALGNFGTEGEGAAASAGYEGAIRVLTRKESGWEPHTLAEDDQRLHHLASADAGEGEWWLASCGYSGRLYVARYER